MIEETTVECPYCGRPSEVEVDISLRVQQFVTDCETCCRPMEVRIETRGGKILSLDVVAD